MTATVRARKTAKKKKLVHSERLRVYKGAVWTVKTNPGTPQIKFHLEAAMRRIWISLSLAAVCALASGTILVVHADDDNVIKFTAKLDGFQELGALNNETGAILTDGIGTLHLT